MRSKNRSKPITLPRVMKRGNNYQTPRGDFALFVGRNPLTGDPVFDRQGGEAFARACREFDAEFPPRDGSRLGREQHRRVPVADAASVGAAFGDAEAGSAAEAGSLPHVSTPFVTDRNPFPGRDTPPRDREGPPLSTLVSPSNRRVYQRGDRIVVKSLRTGGLYVGTSPAGSIWISTGDFAEFERLCRAFDRLHSTEPVEESLA